MNDPDRAHQDLARRNGAAVLDTLGRQDAKIQAQQQRIDALNNALASIMARLVALEQLTAVQRVVLMGAGPTVKTP